MPLKIFIKDTTNSWILNWPTSPKQPKYQIPFHKSLLQDFVRRSLIMALN